ncbi:uncharacterized protein LOC109503919 [Harpegnathos saltator]|uniref:uncharacterized protein LOC109503919 n=1 Tax=Harpegnathos saltator TaxID=610380 RepID=UPI000948C5DF|nr:uncharacterized protein LOC109503919 [Harpegnathos saltator]
MGRVPITPQMLRTAVKELQMHQLFVDSKVLGEHIQRYYPVERDLVIFEQELQEKLMYAVCVGLLAKHDKDQYYIPNLRQEANAIKTAISAFWELYKNVKQITNFLVLIFIFYGRNLISCISSFRILDYRIQETRPILINQYHNRDEKII